MNADKLTHLRALLDIASDDVSRFSKAVRDAEEGVLVAAGVSDDLYADARDDLEDARDELAAALARRAKARGSLDQAEAEARASADLKVARFGAPRRMRA